MDDDDKPIEALRRFADELQHSVMYSSNKAFYDINRQRIHDFIDDPHHRKVYESYKEKKGNENIQRKNSYASQTSESSSILTMQSASEFQKCLGPRSRFGEGDGSFFDVWLTTYNVEKNRKRGQVHFVLPKVIPKNGPTIGFKKQYQYCKGVGSSSSMHDDRSTSVLKYENRKKERLKSESNDLQSKDINPFLDKMKSPRSSLSSFVSSVAVEEGFQYSEKTKLNISKDILEEVEMKNIENVQTHQDFYNQYKELQRRCLHDSIHSDRLSIEEENKPIESDLVLSSDLYHMKTPHHHIMNLKPCLSTRSLFLTDCIRTGLDPRPSLFKTDSTSLNLKNKVLNDKIISVLSSSISIMTHVEHINLSKNNLKDDDLEMLLKSLTGCKHLQSIDLANNNITIIGIKIFESYINKFSYLYDVSFRGLKLDDESLSVIVSAIKQTNIVTILDIGENLFGLVKIKSIGELKGNKNKEKDINNDVLAKDLGLYISSPQCKLKTLKLDWTRLRGKRFHNFLYSLSINNSLLSIDLSSNNLSSDDGEILGNSLHSNRSLQYLNISNNGISDGITTILCGLKSCNSMIEIDISNNPIGEDGIKSLVSLYLEYYKQINIIANEIHVRIKDYKACWAEPKLEFKVPYRYDLSKPGQRSQCLDMLRHVALATFHSDQGDGDNKDDSGILVSYKNKSNNEDCQLKLVRSSRCHRNDHAASDVDEIGVGRFLQEDQANVDSQSDFQSEFERLVHRVCITGGGEEASSGRPRPSKASSGLISHEKASLSLSILFNEGKKLFTSKLDQFYMNHLKHILTLHDLCDCGSMKEENFVEVLISLMDRVKKNGCAFDTTRYYSREAGLPFLPSCNGIAEVTIKKDE